jgi:hypothetical protein
MVSMYNVCPTLIKRYKKAHREGVMRDPTNMILLQGLRQVFSTQV